MKIPPGTQCDKIFRLKGKGMPDLHSHDFGDELVRVNIDIPVKLSSQQRQLMEEFARLSGETPGEKESFTDRMKRPFR
jgi:molecular chaperone DnaJ